MLYLNDHPIDPVMRGRPQGTKIKTLMVIILLALLILITGCTKRQPTTTSFVEPTGQTEIAHMEGSPLPETTGQPVLETQSAIPPVIYTPTSILTPPVTPTETCWVVVTADRAVLRAGPGRNYSIIGTATKGERYRLLGRNQVGDWLYILYGQDRNAWIPAILVRFSCDINSLPEIPGPLTPAPVQTPTPPKPTTEPYGGGLLIPPDLDGALPVPAPNSARIYLSILILLTLIGVSVMSNRQVFLSKTKVIAKLSARYILQLITSIF